MGAGRRSDGDIDRQIGKPSAAVEYLGKQNGHWIAVPSIPNTLTLPSVGRIDLFKQYVGLDLTKMYPAGAPPDKELTDNWTWDFWLKGRREMFTRPASHLACR